VNLFKLSTVLGVSAEDIYKEMWVTAIREVEEKKLSLSEENEWLRRSKQRETAGVSNST
jgi:hypothetical protein